MPSYRNLRGFEIDFDESRPTTVLLGRNGTGKSNLVEAIVEIFRELELGGAPSFAYQLNDVCREQSIQVDADPERTGKRLTISLPQERGGAEGTKGAGRRREDPIRLPGEPLPLRPDRRGAGHRRANRRPTRQVHPDERRRAAGAHAACRRAQ
ncbi:AAA family ATPase [Thiocapsa imhoffii]|uniref:AAA family ATPase n=1 Tax=Thiocapsa imhoffii TaxID=382777 RepID=UPI0030B8DBB2